MILRLFYLAVSKFNFKNEKFMNSLEQVEEKRKEIFTDSYPMSIGELVNLYKVHLIKFFG